MEVSSLSHGMKPEGDHVQGQLKFDQSASETWPACLEGVSTLCAEDLQKAVRITHNTSSKSPLNFAFIPFFSSGPSTSLAGFLILMYL